MLRKNCIITTMIICICFLGLTSCEKKPFDIRFDAEEINFGTVVGGTTVNAVFQFKNMGTETIEIKVVRPTCGCIAAGDWDATTKPGEIGRIPVDYNTEAFEGEVSKITFIDTNITGRESIALVLKGNVFNPVQIFTKTCWLGKIEDENKPVHGSYNIKYNLKTPLEVEDIILPDDKTTARMVTVVPLKEYRLDFTVNPPFKKYEVTVGKIILKVGGEVNRSFDLEFSYLVPAPIQVNPRHVKLDMEKLKREPIERRINIKSNIEDPIEILDLKFDGTGVIYTTTALREHLFLQIPLIFPKGFTFPEDKKIFYLTFRVKNDPLALLYKIKIE
ncbi:MAG: DUF1573 domain-containing protein, partial [Spirochaetales bacterium]|nr:DUF1573 domain-containing protein [Spirochaetales bacterium]